MELKRNILATLAYYDVFDWPLRLDEIAKKMIIFDHLANYSPPAINHQQDIASSNVKDIQCIDIASPEDLRCQSDQLILDKLINRVDGFYFLANREHLVPLRLKREKIAKRKWQLARRAAWWLHFVPYVRAVFASGSLAMNNTDELSDLDALIVVKHGRIWLARFLILGVLSLLRARRKAGDKIAPDKICPNHFITDKSLRIPFESIYTAQTYANLAPIYIDDETLIEEFKKANNWVLDYVVGWGFNSVEIGPQQPMFGSSTSKHSSKEVEPPKGGSTSKTGEMAEPLLRGSAANLWELLLDNSGLGRILENWSRQYQSKRIARNPVTHFSQNGHVVFDDTQLAFHPDSTENEVLKKYFERLNTLAQTVCH